MTLFLQIKRYRDFDRDVLPKIDVLAAEQNITRSDIIRDILYSKFDYIPLLRAPEQVNEDHIEERQEENKIEYPCIEVRVDTEFRWMFFGYLISQPGRLDSKYRRFLNQTLYNYFGIEAPKLLH
jgi:hypothetical protein